MKSVNKEIFKFDDVSDKITKAVNSLVDPIKGTISPRGASVIFTGENGGANHTNDGFTIARNINVSDPISDIIIEIIKEAAIKTNIEAGDGTSTTALLSQVLIREGMRKTSEGWNKMQLVKEIEKSTDKILERLKKQKKYINGDKDLHYIANIASNNDKKIAKDVVGVIKTVGKRGLVFIEPSHKEATEIRTDNGFFIRAGLFSPELRTSQDVKVVYENIPVLITDKRLYYHEEAATIIKTALDSNYKSVVVVAQDFLGEALNTFIANHVNGVINVLLIKEPNASKNPEHLDDLAVYLGCDVIRDKKGMLVNKINIKHFAIANKIFSDNIKTIFTPKNSMVTDPNLILRIESLKKLRNDDPDDKVLEERIASLTNGMVTIKVGGATSIEVNERIYRYEDAVNATRSALEFGYLVGGGMALKNAFNPKDHNRELETVFKRFCEATVKQIAINCGQHPDYIINRVNGEEGYNAVSDKVENLIKAGVIDPYKVTEMAIKNSVSVSCIIISSDYLIVKEEENGNE